MDGSSRVPSPPPLSPSSAAKNMPYLSLSLPPVPLGDDASDDAWNGCGETTGFSAFSYAQSTQYHADVRLTREDTELQGKGYGGGGSGDKATEVVAAARGPWAAAVAAASGGTGWASDDGQVPPATEN